MPVLAWLLTYSLHSTLLLAAAWLVTRRMGRRSLALQETIWRCAMIGGLVTASMQLAVAGLGRAPLAGAWTLRAATVETGAPPASEGAPAVAATSPAAVAVTGEEAAPVAATGEVPAAPMQLHAPPTRGSLHGAGSRTSLVTAAVARSATLAAVAPAGSPTAPGRTVGAPAKLVGRHLGPSVPARPARSSLVDSGVATRRSGAAWPASGIVFAWLVGAMMLSAAYVRSHVLLRRRLRYRPRVVGGDVLPRLSRLASASGIAGPVRLTCTWRLRVPVALGGRAPEISVPPRALFQLTDEQQDALLAHELAHLARRDPAWLVIAQLLVTLLFFQPLNWVARRRLRDLSELLCDQWAVVHTGRPLSLAGCLAEVAAWSIGPRRPALPVPGMADRPSQLAYRIRRLLDGSALQGKASVRRETLWLAAGVLAAVALIAPGVSAGTVAAAPLLSPRAAVGLPPLSGASVAIPARAVRRPATLRTARADQADQDAAKSAPLAAVAGLDLDPLPRATLIVAALAPAAPASDDPLAAAPAPPSVPPPPADTSAEALPPPSDDPPHAAPKSDGPSRDLDAPEVAVDPAAESDRIAAAAARLEALGKLSDLSQAQLDAISKTVDQITHDINGRLQEQLTDLDHRINASKALTSLPALQAHDLARLDGDLAKITAHMDISPEAMARFEADFKKLAADAPSLSRQEIQRIEKEMRIEMQNHPNGDLSTAQIDQIKADAARAMAESRAAMAQALPPAEREKILADARRLAAQARPDKAQAEALRHLAQERKDLARLLDQQRADLESMRRDIEREAAAYRDLARRESEAHRLLPHAAPKPAPAPKAAPAIPPAAAKPPLAAKPPAPAPPAYPTDSAPPAAAPQAPESPSAAAPPAAPQAAPPPPTHPS